MKKAITVIQNKARFLLPLAAAAIAALLFYRCPFKLITGLDCPGCGLTRAFCSILLGDFQAAVMYHPLSPLIFAELFFAVYYQLVLGKAPPRRPTLICLFLTAALMAAAWIIKIL